MARDGVGAPRVPARLARRVLALLSDFPAAAEQRHGRAGGSTVARRAFDTSFDDRSFPDHRPCDSTQRNFRAALPIGVHIATHPAGVDVNESAAGGALRERSEKIRSTVGTIVTDANG